MAMRLLGRNVSKYIASRPLSAAVSGASIARGGTAMAPPPPRHFCSGTPPPSEKGLFRRLFEFLDKALPLPLWAFSGGILGYYYNREPRSRDDAGRNMG